MHKATIDATWIPLQGAVCLKNVARVLICFSTLELHLANITVDHCISTDKLERSLLV